ncbi:Methylenetetrahydrofolate dehydrogenase [Sphaceloma murrayae]|uniref:Methylenetetrahydrofolate dehydrogenase [NAD(+)] n=1 Tax=Sphaceloma murrayae TaxID=2082308 RepID=A0A2K1QLN7_9PEZI|nr:Methylenetetrahydrofolate dehydrogenase [Sphaceloma murrayae]
MAASTGSSGSCKVVLAASIAKKLQGEVAEGLAKASRKPHLVGFLANKDPAARMYADWTGKTCRENQFDFTLREVDREDLENAILTANGEDAVDGILVYYPVFNSARDRNIQYIVDLHKDVEGLTPQLINNMYQNVRFLDPPHNTQKSILPCTPLAMIKILEYLQIYNTFLDYGKRLFGRRITVINRSEVVGRPLAALLANDGAEVYSVDVTGVQHFSRGKGLRKQQHDVTDKPDMKMEDCLAISDVVISGVPGEGFKVPTAHVRDGAVCINFSSEKNFTPDIKEKASLYVPAVGKVTIMILLRNLLRLVQNRPDTKSEPAAAVEKPGTVEAS